jgi:hypothetical protein
MANNSNSSGCVNICSPVRNRYFYGKMLDVFHFELEQTYFNNKRYLLNRLVSGYGVICGLNVTLGSDGNSVVVSPGVAIDKCGREIIVCQPSAPYPLPLPPTAPPTTGSTPPSSTGLTGPIVPPASSGPPTIAPTPTPTSDCNESGVYKYLSICYHECPADPSPALGGDCDSEAVCTPGSIREKYCLKLSDGKLCPASTTSPLRSMVSGGTLNYSMLATYVADLQCLNPSMDCCIPLANIQIPTQPQTYTQNSINIAVRPLLYTADMLYELLLALMNQGQTQLQGGK